MYGNGYRYAPRAKLPEIKWSEPICEPPGNITREVFAKRARNLLTNFVEDHEAMTGVARDEKMTFEEWCEELSNAYHNTF